MKLLQAGSCERLKCGVHIGLGSFAALCFAYNAAAFILRRETHLARNAVLYGALVALEIAQVTHHCRPKPFLRILGVTQD